MFGNAAGGAGSGGNNFKMNFGGFGSPGGGFGGFTQNQQQKQHGHPELFSKSSSSGMGISILGESKFPDASSKFLWIVFFYANDSQESAAMKPQIEKLAASLKGTFKTGVINCKLNSREGSFCTRKGINMQSLPSFGVVSGGELYLYDLNHSPTLKELHEFAVEKIPYHLVTMCNHPQTLEDRLLSPMRKGRKVGSILLLTDKYETSPKYASLAYQYRNEFLFGESRAKTLSMAQHFKVKKYPTLIAFLPKGDAKSHQVETIRLDEVKAEDIGTWLDDLVSKYGTKANTGKRKR
jgi:hypothetical protein